MKASALLNEVEKQLVWLKQQKNTFLNVDHLSVDEQKQLYEGLKNIIPQIEVSNSNKQGRIPLEATQSKAKPLSQTKPIPAPQGIQHLRSIFSDNKPSPAKNSSQTRPTVAASAPPSYSSERTTTPLTNKSDVPPAPPHKSITPTGNTMTGGTASIQTLESLYQQFCQCQRCPLGATRTNFVYGVGNPKTAIMFIGEGPGADEDRLGEPFVGKAGRLLNQMLHAIGVDRPDIYIANVVKCRPPKNRNPMPEEIAKCFPILQRQIELIDPRLIVTLGNVPTRALIPSAPGITKARGQKFQYQKWSVLPTFHPAYLLRNPSALVQAWDDFKKIMYHGFEQVS